ncbi:hypothetical protein ASC95_01265 [Pelomonas sp. Root1217]|uniref:hypothetical protein n=1 Tax=Pelomonas sp. Root1217 TaxID=1736430 RepID=UPI000712DB38|nr:hypothetical protein [Pelomonas sp. Root1217]KQV60136.1 hypothetical protein ASC95_01265 [Pelomonas sp. Root1217]
MSNTEEPVPGRWLYALGGALTLAYLVLLGLYCFGRWAEIRGLAPNNIGDFLAGAFSPLAFAWLVLGFIQQGIELRQNSAALRLQAEELRSAAEHAGAMVELQRKEFDLRIEELEDARAKADEAAAAQARRREQQAKWREEEAIKQKQPRLRFTLFHRDHRQHHIARGTLENDGPACTNVSVELEGIPDVLSLERPFSLANFPSKLKEPMAFVSHGSHSLTQPLTVRYTDSDGVVRTVGFIVSVTNSVISVDEADDI